MSTRNDAQKFQSTTQRTHLPTFGEYAAAVAVQ